MSSAPERTREYRNHHLDSKRWDAFVARHDDIVVTTAYKAGTTWTQGEKKRVANTTRLR